MPLTTRPDKIYPWVGHLNELPDGVEWSDADEFWFMMFSFAPKLSFIKEIYHQLPPPFETIKTPAVILFFMYERGCYGAVRRVESALITQPTQFLRAPTPKTV